MNSDAITAGVRHGGLNSRTEIRVLICYILHNYKEPVALDKVKEKLHFDGIANYFEITYAISDLLESGHIKIVEKIEGINMYGEAGDCAKIATALATSVPLSVRDHAMDITEKVSSRIKNEKENKILIEKSETGIYVTCSVMDNNRELVSVKLLVPDNQSAEQVKENFLNDPVSVLIKATEGLIGTKI